MTDQTNNDWTPVSERMPTDEDGKRFDITLEGDSGYRWVSEGRPLQSILNKAGFDVAQIRMTAWRVNDKPAPYVPPEPEKREPRGVWIEFADDGKRVVDVLHEPKDAEGLSDSFVWCEETLDGNPDPDDVREALELL